MAKPKSKAVPKTRDSGRGPAGETDGKRKFLNLRLLVVAALIVVVAGGIAALGLSSASSSTTAIQVGGATPAPWEYDPVNDRHWHAEHGHWHPGPPPPESGRVNTPAVTPITTTGSELVTGGATPLPWEYDAENDRHWHPDHGHWHDGPPPANATAPTVTPLGTTSERIAVP